MYQHTMRACKPVVVLADWLPVSALRVPAKQLALLDGGVFHRRDGASSMCPIVPGFLRTAGMQMHGGAKLSSEIFT